MVVVASKQRIGRYDASTDVYPEMASVGERDGLMALAEPLRRRQANADRMLGTRAARERRGW